MDDTGISTIEHGGMTLTSTGVTEKDAKASLAQSDAQDAPEKPEKEAKADKPKKLGPSDHARELGKRGGKAAAERRAEAAKEAPAAEEPVKARDGQEGPEEEPEPEEGAEAADKDEEPLSKRAQRRIEVATRKQAEARRELEAERARARQLEAEVAAYRVRGEGSRGESAKDGAADRREQPVGDPSGKPRIGDFDDHEDYLDARDKWNRDEWERDLQRRHHAASTVDTVKSHVDTFLKHVTPELRERIDPELLDMTPTWFMREGQQITADNLIANEAIYLREQGPAVLEYLSEHLEELQRLRALGTHPGSLRRTHEAIRVRMGIIAGILGSKSDATAGDPPDEGDGAPKRQTSKASPPVRPVTGAPHIADGDGAPREGDDFDAWYRRQKRA
jgi:hypothetical protein